VTINFTIRSLNEALLRPIVIQWLRRRGFLLLWRWRYFGGPHEFDHDALAYQERRVIG
jgi:hypothetical protein